MTDRLDERLASKAKRGFRGHPLATIAFYGPDRATATKVAVAVFRRDASEPAELKRWHSAEGDVRQDELVGQEVIQFLEAAGVRSVVMSEGVIGCPHEEGPDYPVGKSCPKCPYWAGRDQWTDEQLH